MIKIKDGKAVFTKERVISPRQMKTLESIRESAGDDSARLYTESLLGLRKGKTPVREYEHRARGTDQLKRKKTKSVLRRLLSECNTRQDYRPGEIDFGEWVGIEIECFLRPNEELVFDTDHRGERIPETDEMVKELHFIVEDRVRQQLQAHRVRRVHVKHDNSLGCALGGIPLEFTLLMNGKYGFEQLYKLDKVLRANAAYANPTCGLHVHLDARHIKESDLKTIERRFNHALPLILAMMPAHRVSNTRYCAPQVSRAARYSAVNLSAYDKFQTVEIRIHEGTVEASEIIPWVQLLKLIATTDTPGPAQEFRIYKTILSLPEHLAQYCEQRIHINNPSFLGERIASNV